MSVETYSNLGVNDVLYGRPAAQFTCTTDSHLVTDGDYYGDTSSSAGHGIYDWTINDYSTNATAMLVVRIQQDNEFATSDPIKWWSANYSDTAPFGSTDSTGSDNTPPDNEAQKLTYKQKNGMLAGLSLGCFDLPVVMVLLWKRCARPSRSFTLRRLRRRAMELDATPGSKELPTNANIPEIGKGMRHELP